MHIWCSVTFCMGYYGYSLGGALEQLIAVKWMCVVCAHSHSYAYIERDSGCLFVCCLWVIFHWHRMYMQFCNVYVYCTNCSCARTCRIFVCAKSLCHCQFVLSSVGRFAVRNNHLVGIIYVWPCQRPCLPFQNPIIGHTSTESDKMITYQVKYRLPIDNLNTFVMHCIAMCAYCSFSVQLHAI